MDKKEKKGNPKEPLPGGSFFIYQIIYIRNNLYFSV